MEFLSSALKCLGVLLWALFALGYPLYGSIRAMETNSDHQMRKLITYWILFSLISLFDLAFLNFMPWITIWTYIKLVVICCLTLPRFQGSYHVYKSFLQPYLQVNIQEIINMINEYAKENGTEALQKLISTKENKAVEPTETITAAATKLIEKATKKNEDTKMASEEKAVDAKAPLMEWSCGICQVKTNGKTIFDNHLQGRKHKTNYQALIAQQKSVNINNDSKTCVLGDEIMRNKTKNKEKVMQIKAKNEQGKRMRCDLCGIWCSGEASMVSHLYGKKHLSRVNEVISTDRNQSAK